MTNRLRTFGFVRNRIVESFIWYVYLLFLITCSFNSQRIDSQYWLYFASAFIAYTGLLTTFIYVGGRYNQHALQRAKWVMFYMLGTIALMIFQIIMPMEYRFGAMPWSSAAPTWFEPVSVISVVPEKTHWLVLSHLLVLCGFFVGVVLIDSRARVKQMLISLILISGVHSLAGLYAYFTEIHLVDPQQLDGHFQIARGWFVNRNHFAAFLSLNLVGCLAYLLKAGLMSARHRGKMSPTQLIICTVFACLSVIAIVLSQSRAGLACIVLALLAVMLIVRRQGVKVSINVKFIIVVLAAIGTFSVYYGQKLLSRFSGELFSVGERSTQWGITWEAIKQAPILGYGGGSYGTIFQVFRENADLRQVIYNQSHNEYLHIWLEQGVVGLIIWLSILWLIFRQATKIIQNSKSTLNIAVAVAATAVLAAALIQAGFDFNLQILNIRWYFFAIVAMLFSLSSVSHSHSRYSNKRNSSSA